MAKDSSTLIGLGIAAAVGYYGYTQGWFSILFGSWTSSNVTAAAAPSGATSSSVTAASSATPASTSQPSYSGPSLDQIFEALLQVTQAAYGSDPAVTCSASGIAGFGLVPGHGVTQTATPVVGTSRLGYNPVPVTSVPVRPVGGTVSNRSVVPAAAVVAPCSMPYATADVFNWYLVNRANVGVNVGPNPADHTTVMSLQDYWTWAAPLLQQSMPGLAGGWGGLGAYAELGRILQMQSGRRF